MSGTTLQPKKSSSPMPTSNGAATNAGGEVLFSPTSAAAWALSTLHNFGAAAPTDNASRPSTESLTGTRLFNNGVVTSSGSAATPVTSSSANLSAQTLHPGIVANTQPTTGVTWGQTQMQHRASVSPHEKT